MRYTWLGNKQYRKDRIVVWRGKGRAGTSKMSKAKGSHGVGIGIKENSTRGWTVIPRLNTVSKDHRLVM